MPTSSRLGRTLNRRRLLRTTALAALGTPLLARSRLAPVGRVRALDARLVPSVYAGTASLVVGYSDVYGRFAGTKEYQHNVLVGLNRPATDGQGRAESNPFNLYVIPDPPELVANEGVVEIHSAVGFVEPLDREVLSPTTGNPVPSSAGGTHRTSGDSFLVQYWTLASADATMFEGVLADPHNAEAVSLNFVNALNEIAPGITMVWPYPMGAGTALAGQIDGQTLAMEIAGNSIDQSRPFYVQVAATRIG